MGAGGVNGRERILRGRRRAAQDRRGHNLQKPSCKLLERQSSPMEISSQEASSQEEGEPPQQNGGVEPVPAKRARRVNVKYR